MKILRKSKTRHIYLVQKVLLQGELSYYIKKHPISEMHSLLYFFNINESFNFLVYYFTQFSNNLIVKSLEVSIFTFMPIGITIFFSICPKLFDFIIGPSNSLYIVSNKICSSVI